MPHAKQDIPIPLGCDPLLGCYVTHADISRCRVEQQALEDFRARIAKYEEVYETITDRNMHYIKLIDMCAAAFAVLQP